MAQFPKKFNQFCKDVIAKQVDLRSLLTDSITTLRSTKYDAESDSMLIKYIQFYALAGDKPVLDHVRNQLETFLTGFGGSFQKEWEVTEVSA